MINKASYRIFDILGFNAGFFVRDLDFDPRDEVAYGRARLGQSRFLAFGLSFFFRGLFLAGTFTYSSSFVEVLGLFTSDFLTAVFREFTDGSFSRFRKSGILLTTVCGAVWQPSSLILLTLWARTSSTQCAQIRYRRSDNYRSTSCPW